MGFQNGQMTTTARFSLPLHGFPIGLLACIIFRSSSCGSCAFARPWKTRRAHACNQKKPRALRGFEGLYLTLYKWVNDPINFGNDPIF